MEKDKHLGLHIDRELHYKLQYVSKYDGRSISGKSCICCAGILLILKNGTARLSCRRKNPDWSAEDGVAPPIPAGVGGRFAVSLSAHD